MSHCRWQKRNALKTRQEAVGNRGRAREMPGRVGRNYMALEVMGRALGGELDATATVKFAGASAYESMKIW